MNLVLVTGAPGSGKTAMATPLSRELGFALITKDGIKEALDNALVQTPRDRRWSETLGRATYAVMWTVAPYFDNLVLECNFYPRSRGHRERILSLSPRPVEVYCDCPVVEAGRRYARRAPSRHAVHVESHISAEKLAQFDRPLALGPVLQVDTTAPVDIAHVSAWVRHALQERCD